PELEVKEDGSVVGRAVWGSPAPIDPGAHTVTASAPGKRSWTAAVQIKANGALTRLEIPPLESEAATTTPPSPVPVSTKASPDRAPPPASDTSSTSGSTQRLLGWITGGVGVVGLGVGMAFELRRSSKLSERDGLCPTNVCDTVEQKNRISTLTDDVNAA